jgi:hypothetical protein
LAEKNYTKSKEVLNIDDVRQKVEELARNGTYTSDYNAGTGFGGRFIPPTSTSPRARKIVLVMFVFWLVVGLVAAAFQN